ncbi:MAG: hypothetical protein IIA09_11695, partial [Proteobacteria bacterium]|nr:hypothetical protein [Pseudomonadota bacterium]
MAPEVARSAFEIVCGQPNRLLESVLIRNLELTNIARIFLRLLVATFLLLPVVTPQSVAQTVSPTAEQLQMLDQLPP